jgi:hypothetical protein
MTIPWLHNCPHKKGTWCLTCVGEMGHQRASLIAAMWHLENLGGLGIEAHRIIRAELLKAKERKQ